MLFSIVLSTLLLAISNVNAFDDTALQLALDVVDKTVVQTFFTREGNQELFNYINKYRQLISQVIRIIKKIDFKSWNKVKKILQEIKVFKTISFPKFGFNKASFKEKLLKFGFNQEKIKLYMPKLTKNVESIQKKLTSIGITEGKVNKIRSTMADAMFLMSKVYTVFIYANMLLKGAAFSQLFKRSDQTTEAAAAMAA